jgi:hypothetical protein
MKGIRAILVMCVLLAAVGVQAQQSLIKTKTTRIIAKLDLYWSAVVIAENFPTFFPLELEINLPKPRLSFEAVVSPWVRKYNTQTESTRETSFTGGLGLRYYFLGNAFPDAATGMFLEPEVFYQYNSSRTDSITLEPKITESSEWAAGGAIGYQHVFLDWLYLQGRVSFLYGAGTAMPSYRVSDKFLILPWVGIGFGLH